MLVLERKDNLLFKIGARRVGVIVPAGKEGAGDRRGANGKDVLVKKNVSLFLKTSWS